MVITGDADSTLSNLERRIKESVDNILMSHENISHDAARSPRFSNPRIKPKKLTASGKRTIAEITGIEKTLFPLENKLSVAQTSRLVREMIRLLNVCGFQPDYPVELSVRQKYHLLLSKWENQYEVPKGTRVYLKFCDCEPVSCPFDQRICQCKTFNGFDDFYDDTTIIF